MKKSICTKIAVVGISALLMTQLYTGRAYATWGLQKLLEIRSQQGYTTTPIPTTPSPTTTPSTPTTPVPQPTTPATQPSATGEMSQEEALMLNLVNSERVKNGLKPLQPMPELNRLARLKSTDIIEKNYFSHTSPTYGSFANMVYNAGIRFRSVGENLAEARNATHAHTLLMASAGHRANILSTNFTHIGIGIVPYEYGVAVTQLFIMQ
jgi:uncharacterized YkwD family protein